MIHKKIRLAKKDSAFVYAILESLEGYASYSTLPETNSLYRDLELSIVPELSDELEIVFNGMRKKFPILVL